MSAVNPYDRPDTCKCAAWSPGECACGGHVDRGQVRAWAQGYEAAAAERDRARGVAVALEQRLARIDALESYWADLAATAISPDGREWLTAAHQSLRAALGADA